MKKDLNFQNVKFEKKIEYTSINSVHFLVPSISLSFDFSYNRWIFLRSSLNKSVIKILPIIYVTSFIRILQTENNWIFFSFFFCVVIKDAIIDGDKNVNFETEINLNIFCSRKEPYCSLCSVFSSNPVSSFGQLDKNKIECAEFFVILFFIFLFRRKICWLLRGG